MNNTNREAYFDISIEVFNQAANTLGSLIGQRSHFIEKDKQLHFILASCCNTSEAIYKLLDSDTTLSKGYMLMRVLLEKLVNFHYLRCSSVSELKRYQDYPYYRYYHSLGQKVYGHTMSAEINNSKADIEKLQSVPPFNEVLRMFSATDPTLLWTRKSFSQKVRHICRREPGLESMLVLSQILTYTDTSEMLHGTMWGIYLLSGIYDLSYFKNPNKPTETEVRKFYSQKIGQPLSALSELILLTIKLVASAANLSAYKIKAEAALEVLEQQR